MRSKQAKDILKVTSDISWNKHGYNENVMKFLLALKGPEHTLESLLTPEEINDYFKISSCCEGVKAVFEKYAGVRLSNFREYLRPVMSKPAFL